MHRCSHAPKSDIVINKEEKYRMKKLFTALTACLLVFVMLFSFVACEQTPDGTTCTDICPICNKCQNPECKEHSEKCPGHSGNYDTSKTPMQNLAANVSSESVSKSLEKFVLTLKDVEGTNENSTEKDVISISGLEIAVSDGQLKASLTDFVKESYDKTGTTGPVLSSRSKVNIKAATEGGKLYADAITEETSRSGEENIFKTKAILNLSEAIQYIGDYLKNQNTELYAEFVGTVLPAIKNIQVDDAQAKSALELLDKICAEVTYNEGTYTVTISTAKLHAFNKQLSEMKIDRILDEYFGEGTYAKLADFIDAIPTYTVGQVVDLLAKNGVTVSDLYQVATKVASAIGMELPMTEKQFTETVESLKDQTLVKTICDLVNKEAVTVDTITAVLEQVKSVLETSTVYQAVAVVYGLVNSDASTDAATLAKQMFDSVEKVIDEIAKFEFALKINSNGEFVSAHFAVKQYTQTQTDETDTQTSTISFTLDVAFGAATSVDYADVIADGKAHDLSGKIDEIAKNAVSTDTKKFEVKDGKVIFTEVGASQNNVTVGDKTYSLTITGKTVYTIPGMFVLSAYAGAEGVEGAEYSASFLAQRQCSYTYKVEEVVGGVATEVTDKAVVDAVVAQYEKDNESSDFDLSQILVGFGFQDLCLVSISADVDAEGKYSDVYISCDVEFSR